MRTLALLLSYLLFTLSANSLLGLAQTPVLDTDGNAVRTGVDYYVVPPEGTSTGGGGLGLESRPNHDCPLDVVQELNQSSDGLPLFFLSVNPNDEVVNLSTDQNVQFNASSTCVMSTLWTLVSNNEIPRQYFVTTGGVPGNPGFETLSNWFGIQTFEDAYIFYFCPTVCEICRPVCGPIGVIAENGRKVLGLNRDQPLKVAFKRA